MQKIKLLAALFLAACAPAIGQVATCSTATIPLCTLGNSGAAVQTKPAAVPTSAGIVTTYDAYLQTITVANTTAGALTFTLADRQASPIAVLSAVSIAANSTYVIVFPVNYWCPGGFTVLASGSGLNWYGAFRL